jgi:hypothetical protein
MKSFKIKGKISGYLFRILIAISVLLNVIFFGPSNQTFSARNYARKRLGKFNLVWLIDRLLWFDPSHCQISWIYWVSRKVLIVGEDSAERVELKGLHANLHAVYYHQKYE